MTLKYANKILNPKTGYISYGVAGAGCILTGLGLLVQKEFFSSAGFFYTGAFLSFMSKENYLEDKEIKREMKDLSEYCKKQYEKQQTEKKDIKQKNL